MSAVKRFQRKVARKRPEIIEYMKVKGLMTASAFVEVMNAAGIEMEPHEGQWEIIDAYEERQEASEAVKLLAKEHGINVDFEYKYRCLVAACGRRFGKSVVAALLGACEMLVPHARVLIVSYTLDNCEVIFKQVRQIIVGLLGEKEVVIDRQKDMELELKNGATLRVASNDNVQSKLGTAISLLIIDEAKLFPKKLYEMVLKPMLFDYAPFSRTILISSPEAGWFETYYKYGQDPKRPDVWSINLPTHTNPTIPKDELELMRLTMPPDLYDQEVLGLFTSNAGRVCREFIRDTHVYVPGDYPWMREWIKHNPVIHMIDSGYTHHFGSVWVVFVEELDTFFAFTEYQQAKTLTSVHATNMMEVEVEWGMDVSMRYADPAASQQIADFTEYDLCFNKADKSLLDTIINLNTLFFQKSAVTGKPRLLISNECTELIRQLESVQWKESREDFQTKEKSAAGTKPFKPDNEQRTDWDLFDGFRYGMYSFVKANGIAVNVLEGFGQVEEELDPYTRALIEAGYIQVEYFD